MGLSLSSQQNTVNKCIQKSSITDYTNSIPMNSTEKDAAVVSTRSEEKYEKEEENLIVFDYVDPEIKSNDGKKEDNDSEILSSTSFFRNYDGHDVPNTQKIFENETDSDEQQEQGDMPCHIPKSKSKDNNKKNSNMSSDIDWYVIDRICNVKRINQEICPACRVTNNMQYLMISSFGVGSGTIKFLMYCVCKDLDLKYLPMDETVSLKFSSSDIITTIFNFIHKQELRNSYVFGQ